MSEVTDIERSREVWEPVNDPLMVGWQHIRNRQNIPNRFKSPSGEVMGARQYGTHKARVHGEQSGKTPPTQPEQLIGVPDLPVPDLDKPDAAIKKAGLATPAELAEVGYIVFMLFFTILAFLVKIPEIAMTQDEAWAFAAPLGNILEKSTINRRYGKYLKEGSDYLYLGYALWGYSSRVQQSVQARRMQEGYVQGGVAPGRGPARSVPSGPVPPVTSGPTSLPSAAHSPSQSPPSSPPPAANGNAPQAPVRATADNRVQPAASSPFLPKVG